MDNMAIWAKFTQTGKVEDYLVYRQAVQNKAEGNCEQQYEDEHRGTDFKGTEYT